MRVGRPEHPNERQVLAADEGDVLQEALGEKRVVQRCQEQEQCAAAQSRSEERTDLGEILCNEPWLQPPSLAQKRPGVSRHAVSR